MRPNRPISFDAKIEMLNGLGDLSLACPERFTWVTRHAGVTVTAGDGEEQRLFMPEAFATNPYAAVEVHWRMLTDGSPILILTGHGVLRHVFWEGRRFLEIEA